MDEASFSYSNGVLVRVTLVQSTTTMYVQREPQRTLLLFLSSLLGSVIGLLGALAWLMQKMEGAMRKMAATRSLLQSRRHTTLVSWRTSLWTRNEGVEMTKPQPQPATLQTSAATNNADTAPQEQPSSSTLR